MHIYIFVVTDFQTRKGHKSRRIHDLQTTRNDRHGCPRDKQADNRPASAKESAQERGSISRRGAQNLSDRPMRSAPSQRWRKRGRSR